jgi:hypothetical protein
VTFLMLPTITVILIRIIFAEAGGYHQRDLGWAGRGYLTA